MRGTKRKFPTALGTLLVLGIVAAGCGSARFDSADAWTTRATTVFDSAVFSLSVSPDGQHLASTRVRVASTRLRELCITSLADTDEDQCFEAETLGTDSLRWNADSSMVAATGSTGGSFHNTGVWTVDLNGIGQERLPASEGHLLLPDDPNEQRFSGAFRPSSESIVFLDWGDDSDNIQLVEVDEAGAQTVLATDAFSGAQWPVVPLSDGRVIVSVDDFNEGRGVVDLIGQGNARRLVTGKPLAIPLGEFPAAVAIRPSAEDLVLIVIPGGLSRTSPTVSQWFLTDLLGQRFDLTTTGEQSIVAATFSPDGEFLAYLTYDFELLTGAFHVERVEALVTGEPELLGSIPIDVSSTNSALSDIRLDDPANEFGAIRWTPEDEVVFAYRTSGNDDVELLTVDLNPN